jgi:hypothetical protein
MYDWSTRAHLKACNFIDTDTVEKGKPAKLYIEVRLLPSRKEKAGGTPGSSAKKGKKRDLIRT